MEEFILNLFGLDYETLKWLKFLNDKYEVVDTSYSIITFIINNDLDPVDIFTDGEFNPEFLEAMVLQAIIGSYIGDINFRLASDIATIEDLGDRTDMGNYITNIYEEPGVASSGELKDARTIVMELLDLWDEYNEDSCCIVSVTPHGNKTRRR